MRKARIMYNERLAGYLQELERNYVFSYDGSYLSLADAQPIAFSFPLTDQAYVSESLFPFFDNLLPEGFLLDLTLKNWKLHYNDRFGILMKTGKNCIGAVTVVADE